GAGAAGLPRGARPRERVPRPLAEPRDPGATTGDVEPGDPARRAAGALEERGRALDADRQLLPPRPEKRLEQIAGLGTLKHLVGIVRRDATLALEIFAEAP